MVACGIRSRVWLKGTLSPPALRGLFCDASAAGIRVKPEIADPGRIFPPSRDSKKQHACQYPNPLFLMPPPHPTGFPGVPGEGDASPMILRNLGFRVGRPGDNWIYKCLRYFEFSQRAPRPATGTHRGTKQTDTAYCGPKTNGPQGSLGLGGGHHNNNSA